MSSGSTDSHYHLHWRAGRYWPSVHPACPAIDNSGRPSLDHATSYAETVPMLSVLLSLAVQVTQAPAPAAPRPALTVSVRPANPSVVVGDSIRLAGEVRDSSGRPVPNARIRWLGGSFEGGIDSTGLVKAGAVGTFVAYAVPSVDGKPARPTPVSVRILPQPAARVALNHGESKLVVGQRLALDAQVFAANGDRRRDPVTWASTLPSIATV